MKSFISAIFIVFISSNVYSQNINTPLNFPNPNFRAAVEEFMGVAPGGEFTAAEASKKGGELNCANRSIEDITGIELFFALTSLNCSGNQLTNLDIFLNTALEYLVCDSNQLTALDVSNNTALELISCSANLLTSLDVSHNIALTGLACGDNHLTHLNVSHNTALTVLYCGGNQLTNLDVSHNIALERLGCYSNQLTTLDVSYNTALDYISCDGNQLTSLDVSHNIALNHLFCNDNQLTSLSSLVASEGLGPGDRLDVRNNYIGCIDPDAAMSDIQILTERIGEAIFHDAGWLQSGFAFSPQKECETAVLDWSLH